MFDVLTDTAIDAIKMLPFLFLACIAIEYIEHVAGDRFTAFLSKFGKAGSIAGAILGVIPQCGFSVACSNLYASRIISAGTLLAVFISTSDEAIPVLISSPESAGKILPLVLAKIALAIVCGMAVDMSGIFKTTESEKEEVIEEHANCGEGEESLALSALKHTLSIFAFLVLVMLILNFAIFFIGEERLSGMLMTGSVIQPLLAAVIGLIPNCASSVIIAELYADGLLSFGSALAGLSSGSGLGLLMLFKADINRKEALKLALILFGVSAVSGTLIHLFV